MIDGSYGNIKVTSQDGTEGYIMPTTQTLNAVTVRGTRIKKEPAKEPVIQPDYAPQIDARLRRSIGLYKTKISNTENAIVTSPYETFDSYVMMFHETPTAIENEIILAKDSDKSGDSSLRIEALTKRKKYVETFNEKYRDSMKARMSLIHPYALFMLYGSTDFSRSSNSVLFDSSDYRKWYEVDGNDKGGYAKIPTTARIIDWGNEDTKGRTPYAFQDFLFCKYWNKIPNNRMITLRRYATPVFDDLEFPDYANRIDNESDDTVTIPNGNTYFTPVATAVTYFGEDTENTLSEIMQFSYHYNWKELHSEKDPIMTSSAQNNEGQIGGLDNAMGAALNRGLRTLSHALGFLSDMSGGQAGVPALKPRFAAASTPPDPYSNGPYENRILGPVNVIMDTYKRERGLTFQQENLTITFNYVSRPIDGVNNKAILLDLLANILLMTYANGTWFGGLWRYWKEHPAVYPWKYGDVANKLYEGKIFGEDGAAMTLVNRVKEDSIYTPYLSGFLTDALESIKVLAGKLMEGIMSIFGGETTPKDNETEKERKEREEVEKQRANELKRGLERTIARRAMSGATVPYIENMKALLTGEAVGEWHLTIGNPLNPIAMIGNLIVKNSTITFSDELGPDDFPIGFTAKIELAHGLGRDKEAIESMFNRGKGRIYSLGDNFKTYADGETKVDENTGATSPRTKADMTWAEHWGGGYNYIQKIMEKPLNNRGGSNITELRNIDSISLDSGNNIKRSFTNYMASPWQIGNNL